MTGERAVNEQRTSTFFYFPKKEQANKQEQANHYREEYKATQKEVVGKRPVSPFARSFLRISSICLFARLFACPPRGRSPWV